MQRHLVGGARSARHPATGRPWSASHPLWGRGFRPFFLTVGIYGAFGMVAWVAILNGAVPAPGFGIPSWWHAHEMLFGVVGAAIAGFLLTAAPVWAGRPAPAGTPLLGLALVFWAGRLAMLLAGVLPGWGVAVLDGAFLPLLAWVLLNLLWGTGQIRNQAVVALVASLAAANLVLHAEFLGLVSGWAPTALRISVDLVVVLMVVVGGRITPAFTANALRLAGLRVHVRSLPWLERALLVALVALTLGDVWMPRTAVTGVLATVSGWIAVARMWGWQTRHTLGAPLLWTLHAGAAWIALGLILVGAGDLGAGVPAAAGLHALTAGAMGTLILAVMTRVALGHTGRPLVPPTGALGVYALVQGAAIVRVVGSFLPASSQIAAMNAAGALWVGAFALFGLIYAPILTSPRVDGLEG